MKNRIILFLILIFLINLFSISIIAKEDIYFSIDNITGEIKGEDWGKIDSITFTIKNFRSIYLWPSIYIYLYEDDYPEDRKNYIEEKLESLVGVSPGDEGAITLTANTNINFNEIYNKKTLKAVLKDRNNGTILKTIYKKFKFQDQKLIMLTEEETNQKYSSFNYPSNKDDKADTQSSSKSTLFGTIEVAFIGFVVGLIILIILSVMIIKYIKNRPKIEKHKKSEEDIQEQPETETKSAIPKNISEAISIKNFTVKHGRSLILDNVDLDIKRGELVSLLGPSGTGKSTIIEAIVGRKSPTKGNIKIFNEDIKNKRIFDHVGFVPQHAELYMNQTVEQNLLSSATKWGIRNAKNRIDDVLSTVGLSQRKDLKANKLSGGQLKLLSLAMELIRDPELLILDEPTTGLDPNTRDNIITILSRISTKQNKTVFFTTHFMDDAEECDEVIIIAKGKIVAQGPPSKLEKRLPGHGRVVNIILDNVTDDLLKNIEKIQGVEKIISEGRNIKIITEEPNAVKLGQKIDELGGVVNKTEITNATMKEVFVYYTGEDVKE